MTGWIVITHPGEVCHDPLKRGERTKGRKNDRSERVRGGTPSRSNGTQTTAGAAAYPPARTAPQLRIPAAQKRRPHEADPGVAGT